MNFIKRFDHIGVVVEDLDRAVEELAAVWGLKCEERMDIAASGIRIAFYPLGGGHMEIIEFQKPLPGVDPLVTRPGGGVQHVAFQVKDFDAALEKLTGSGLKPVTGFPRRGARGRVAFFYPTEGLHLLMEICEAREPSSGKAAAGSTTVQTQP